MKRDYNCGGWNRDIDLSTGCPAEFMYRTLIVDRDGTATWLKNDPEEST